MNCKRWILKQIQKIPVIEFSAKQTVVFVLGFLLFSCPIQVDFTPHSLSVNSLLSGIFVFPKLLGYVTLCVLFGMRISDQLYGAVKRG